jgi:hypothetical protein
MEGEGESRGECIIKLPKKRIILRVVGGTNLISLYLLLLLLREHESRNDDEGEDALLSGRL